MQCSNCTLESPQQSAQCPNCGFVNAREPRPSFGRRNPVRLILFCFLVLSILVLVVQRVGIAMYRQMQANRVSQETSTAAPRPTPAPEVHATRFAVEHGR